MLDIWSLPNLKELSIRETVVTEAAVAKIAAIQSLQSLTFKNNGPLSSDEAQGAEVVEARSGRHRTVTRQRRPSGGGRH